jgi:hypothetical protein
MVSTAGPSELLTLCVGHSDAALCCTELLFQVVYDVHHDLWEQNSGYK